MADAGCMCAYDYDFDDCEEECSLFFEGRVKTRKEHNCCECGDPIPVGTASCSARWLYEGSWSTGYRCTTCGVLAELVAIENKACPLWGGLRDAAEDAGINWHEFREGKLEERT